MMIKMIMTILLLIMTLVMMVMMRRRRRRNKVLMTSGGGGDDDDDNDARHRKNVKFQNVTTSLFLIRFSSFLNQSVGKFLFFLLNLW